MKTSGRNKRPETKRRKRESLQERVHRHIADINSVITDEDIKNVTPGVTEEPKRNAAPKTESEVPKKKAGRKQKKESETDGGVHKQTTPWDVLSEGFD